MVKDVKVREHALSARERWEAEAENLKDKKGFFNRLDYYWAKFMATVIFIIDLILVGFLIVFAIGGLVGGLLVVPITLGWSAGTTIAVICIVLGLIVIRG